jgi:hypothetical protein
MNRVVESERRVSDARAGRQTFGACKPNTWASLQASYLVASLSLSPIRFVCLNARSSEAATRELYMYIRSHEGTVQHTRLMSHCVTMFRCSYCSSVTCSCTTYTPRTSELETEGHITPRTTNRWWLDGFKSSSSLIYNDVGWQE